ncbi:hypothetical protein ACOMHN_061801 [Nucella lapillus]
MWVQGLNGADKSHLVIYIVQGNGFGSPHACGSTDRMESHYTIYNDNVYGGLVQFPPSGTHMGAGIELWRDKSLELPNFRAKLRGLVSWNLRFRGKEEKTRAAFGTVVK